ncbi:MAG: bifunctional demethylmenaquinone methyltransferase/2-methoxy-6-polyprenyl-1,4-benzoquinol methylase UbiE [Aphanocapsa lilacina HA4352-LM1]|jgi:demethylmenaquinone methyltransferase/2-methoxy-6-polyprenyl-1,4-benzoquinol methylase|nr:bifunctional demethylmenaquinone methyltransferase/2-methoxy-6-polyprenyl-1,4-benzoquinol methylase UbiE [Aphanocapsa lilacina HA4352-LM1]
MQDSRRIQNIFNAIAPVYDRINDRMSFGLHRVWKKMAVRWSGCGPGDTVLDLCCGTGDLAFLLARRVGVEGTVWGVDFAAAQLAQARRRDREGRVRWLEADALDLPFDDDSFDAVTQGFGLRNVVDIPACFAQLRRVLKPGGRAVILDLHAPADAGWRAFQRWYLEGRVTALGRAQGLEAEYAYIAPSLECFPKGDEQVRLARQAGFSQVLHYPLIGGTVGVLVVSKSH